MVFLIWELTDKHPVSKSLGIGALPYRYWPCHWRVLRQYCTDTAVAANEPTATWAGYLTATMGFGSLNQLWQSFRPNMTHAHWRVDFTGYSDLNACILDHRCRSLAWPQILQGFAVPFFFSLTLHWVQCCSKKLHLLRELLKNHGRGDWCFNCSDSDHAKVARSEMVSNLNPTETTFCKMVLRLIRP